MIVFSPLIAASDSDFTLASTVTFLGGLTYNGDTQCVEIQIVDDDIYEEDEVFLVTISTVTPSSAVTIVAPSNVTKTLQDNEGKSDVKIIVEFATCLFVDALVQFEVLTYTVDEEDGDVEICVDSGVTDGFETDLIVVLMAIDGKASEYYNLKHSECIPIFYFLSILHSHTGRHSTIKFFYPTNLP